MDSSDLYHVKQQFTLCAYPALAELTVPADEPNHSAFLLYKTRSLIALNKPSDALSLIPSSTESFPLKACRGLAKYVQASSAGDDGEDESALEELRDLCVEVDGEENIVESEKWVAKVLAATAFARAGETEEALETLGVGAQNESLEAVALVVQIYLSISRADLAKKEQARALKWAEDDLLLQSIEATIGLATGTDAYTDANAFYTEQLANPSLTSSHLLAARGITRLMKGEVSAAKSDLEEVVKAGEGQHEEALAASVVAAGLGNVSKGEADELFAQLRERFPSNPLVQDLQEKESLFDDLVSKFEVPPQVVAASA